MPTRTQNLAQTCYHLVHGVRDASYAKDYGRWCFRFAPLVLQNGLVQALGFLTAKAAGDNEGHRHFRSHLAQILGLPAERMLEHVRDAELGEYQRLTRLALAAMLWFRRYAETELEQDAVTASGEAAR